MIRTMEEFPTRVFVIGVTGFISAAGTPMIIIILYITAIILLNIGASSAAQMGQCVSDKLFYT